MSNYLSGVVENSDETPIYEHNEMNLVNYSGIIENDDVNEIDEIDEITVDIIDVEEDDYSTTPENTRPKKILKRSKIKERMQKLRNKKYEKQGNEDNNHQRNVRDEENWILHKNNDAIIENCPLLIEAENSTSNDQSTIEGNRIINVKYFVDQLQKFPHNALFSCGFENLKIVKDVRNGLKSSFYFKCDMCRNSIIVHNVDKENEMNLNTAAVAGTVIAGAGLTTLDKVLTKMNVPIMCANTYSKHHAIVCDSFVDIAEMVMKEAAEEEKEIAIKEGRVGKDNVPEIAVMVDGSWAKRSFGNNYNSLGGVGVIIGVKTKKVLFVGVKNKYCLICARAKGKASPHACYKNWDVSQSSTAMEAAAIKEGFCRSEELYGLRYTTFIGDGDSSVFNTITIAKPYGDTQIEKIECTNHLLRNFCNKLRKIAESSSQRNTGEIHLKQVLKRNILRMRRAVVKAIAHRRKSGINKKKIELLQQDINNVISHTFGEHQRCKDLKYFCNGKQKMKEINYVPDLKLTGLYDKIMPIIKTLSLQSKSLLYNVTTNAVENFNSVISAFISGKRINYTGRQSYQARINAAVVNFNNGMPYEKLFKLFKGKDESPGSICKKKELLRQKIRIKQRMYRSRRKRNYQKCGQDKDYGDKVNKPDMSWQTYVRERQSYISSLTPLSENERKGIELDTRGQSSNEKWSNMRKKMVTASHFGAICALRNETSTANLVKNIVTNEIIYSKSLAWGTQHEKDAISELEDILKTKIEKRGLCIHPTLRYLGASPDGFIPEMNAVVEVKCPYASADLTPDEGINSRKITFWRKNRQVNVKHKYFYQIQGQMQMMNAQKGIFAVWTRKGLKYEFIKRDDDLWENIMLPKLQKFFENCLLPEIIDSRLSRSLPIRSLTIDGLVVEVKKDLIIPQIDNECDDPDLVLDETNSVIQAYDEHGNADSVMLDICSNTSSDLKSMMQTDGEYDDGVAEPA